MGYSKSIYFNDEEGMTNESVAKKKKQISITLWQLHLVSFAACCFFICNRRWCSLFWRKWFLFCIFTLSTPHTIADCSCTYACTNFFQYAIKTWFKTFCSLLLPSHYRMHSLGEGEGNEKRGKNKNFLYSRLISIANKSTTCLGWYSKGEFLWFLLLSIK